MSLGLKKANNKMAMARGAKFMQVHDLPGWYNKNSNLFGKTIAKSNRAFRYKLKQANAKLAIAGMKQNVAARNLLRANVNIAAQLFKKGIKPKAIGPRWNKARQSGVRTYNKTNLKKNFKSSIGANTNGFGWAKIQNMFYPLVGTRKKGGGYVVNLTRKSSPAKYNSVVKGFLVW